MNRVLQIEPIVGNFCTSSPKQNGSRMAKIYAVFRKRNGQQMEAFYNGWWARQLKSPENEQNLEKIIQSLKTLTLLTIRPEEFSGYNVYCYKSSNDRFAVIITDKPFENSQDPKGLLFNLLEPHLDIQTIVDTPDRYYRTKLLAVQDKLKDTKEIMIDNLQRMIERGEKLNDILDKSEDLVQTAALFKATAKQMNRHWCAKLFCAETVLTWFDNSPFFSESQPKKSPPVIKQQSSPIKYAPHFMPSPKPNNKRSVKSQPRAYQKDKSHLCDSLSCCLKYPKATFFILSVIIISALIICLVLLPSVHLASLAII